MNHRKEDILFMRKALSLAEKAFNKDEVPIGALVVDEQGIIIGAGYNQVEKKQIQIAHAEVLAIEKACKKRKNWRLNGCWLYVTLEPCAMCIGLIRLSRIEGLIYGADSPLFGYNIDKTGIVPLYNENILNTIKGVCATESVQLLQRFFKQKRVKHE